jgi:hypothetical protein
MSDLEQTVQEMEGILDQLIETAERMQEISRQVIVESELASLQETEQKLIDRLMHLDEFYRKTFASLPDPLIQKFQGTLEKKLTHFQQLNSNFIENISASHGLLQFQAKKPQDKDKKQ